MEPRSIQYIADHCRGELLSGNPDLAVRRIGTDSRKVQPGEMFFALQGERFDGHDFLPQVLAAEPAGVVVARDRIPTAAGCAVLAVEQPRQALGALAAAYRGEFDLPIVAVGGSNGKTTTKDFRRHNQYSVDQQEGGPVSRVLIPPVIEQF